MRISDWSSDVCSSDLREIKFKHFLDAARDLGAERIATGHYARIDRHDGNWRLLRARDQGKDQSYFLHQLGQAHTAATVFPIGDLPTTIGSASVRARVCSYV